MWIAYEGHDDDDKIIPLSSPPTCNIATIGVSWLLLSIVWCKTKLTLLENDPKVSHFLRVWKSTCVIEFNDLFWLTHKK